jgi:GTP-binding protein
LDKQRNLRTKYQQLAGRESGSSFICAKLTMPITSAKYTGSYNSFAQLPTDNRPEIAFIGRSNVGKSSLINLLLNRRDLARVSKEPGKTQSLNYYLINESWYLVDCPGYGFAKRSQKQREAWNKLLRQYLRERKTLHLVMLLIDVSIEVQSSDLEFTNKLGEEGVPFVMVFTKADKCSLHAVSTNLKKWKLALSKTWNQLPPHFITSSAKRTGGDELLGYIEDSL